MTHTCGTATGTAMFNTEAISPVIILPQVLLYNRYQLSFPEVKQPEWC